MAQQPLGITRTPPRRAADLPAVPGFDADLYNRVAGPGAHRFEVLAERQPGATAPPDLAGLRLWASYDDGGSWHEAKVEPQAGGGYSVTVVHPPATRRASDSVTLRVEAWDAAGNRVTQTLPDAYRLVDRVPECAQPGCAATRG